MRHTVRIPRSSGRPSPATSEPVVTQDGTKLRKLHEPAAPVTGGAAARALRHLQRTAGNATVRRLLSDNGPPPPASSGGVVHRQHVPETVVALDSDAEDDSKQPGAWRVDQTDKSYFIDDFDTLKGTKGSSTPDIYEIAGKSFVVFERPGIVYVRRRIGNSGISATYATPLASFPDPHPTEPKTEKSTETDGESPAIGDGGRTSGVPPATTLLETNSASVKPATVWVPPSGTSSTDSPVPESDSLPPYLGKQRTATQVEQLIEDAFQAVVENETAGTPTESKMGTSAGVAASFANSSQMIAARVVGSLLQLSPADRAKVTTLTRAELTHADQIMVVAGKVWECVVRGKTVIYKGTIYPPVADETEARRLLGPLLVAARLNEGDDLRRMFAFREFRLTLIVAKATGIPQRALALALLTDAKLIAHSTVNERNQTVPKYNASKVMTSGQRSALVAKIARREVFDTIASSAAATTLALGTDDIAAYYHGGALDRFIEDKAAWQRLALSRLGAGAAEPEFESRIQAAAESGGGFTLSRLNMHSHLVTWLAEHPDATDEQVAAEAAFHNFGTRKGSSAAAYSERILARFPKIRTARASGQPVHRATDTGQ